MHNIFTSHTHCSWKIKKGDSFSSDQNCIIGSLTYTSFLCVFFRALSSEEKYSFQYMPPDFAMVSLTEAPFALEQQLYILRRKSYLFLS